jgi:hypothetical protein
MLNKAPTLTLTLTLTLTVFQSCFVKCARKTATFIIVFAFTLYFYRSYKIHLELELHKNRLEELVKRRTAELTEVFHIISEMSLCLPIAPLGALLTSFYFHANIYNMLNGRG